MSIFFYIKIYVERPHSKIFRLLNTIIGCEDCSMLIKMTLARRQSIVLVNKFEQTLQFVSVFKLAFSTSKYIFVVIIQGRYPHTIMIQTTRQLQWNNGQLPKLLQKTSYLLCWKITGCNKDWLKNLFSSSLLCLHGTNDFQSSSITFYIFKSSTFFDIIGKINEK